MSAPRGRGLRPGGVVRALGRLVVLVAIGFGVGLLFGVVSEEPELLAGHLRGESESVAIGSASQEVLTAEPDPLGRAGEAPAIPSALSAAVGTATRTLRESPAASEHSALPSVAAPRERATAVSPSDGPKAAPRASLALAASAPAASKPPTPPTPPKADVRSAQGAPGWAIQVGSFSEQAAAKRLAEGLRDRFPVEVLPASGQRARWRVRVQPIRSEERAREMAEQLKRDDRLPTWVTPMEGRSGS